MAERYSSKSSGSSDHKTRYSSKGKSSGSKTRYSSSAQTKSSGPHHSIAGFYENLAKGAERAAVGALPALYNVGKAYGDDVWHGNLSSKDSKTYNEVAKPLAKTYAKTYGPLFHGDFKTFGETAYEDPFAIGLDALTLVTGGAGAVGKAGAGLAKAGAISKTSKLALLSDAELTAARASLKPGEATHGIKLRNAAARAGQKNGRTIVKKVSRNPAIRARQQFVDRALKRLPTDAPVVGRGINKYLSEDARFGRATRRETYHESRRLRVLGYPFEKAKNRLGKWERIAFSFHQDAMHPLEEAAHLKELHPNYRTDPNLEVVAKAIERDENPKVIDAYENPSKALDNALTLGRELQTALEEDRLAKGTRQASVRKGLPKGSPLPVEKFDERPFLHLRLARGAKFEKQPAESKALALGRKNVERLQKLHDRASERVGKAQIKMIEVEAGKYLSPENGGKPLREAPPRMRPRTAEEAQARFTELDRQVQAFIAGMMKKVGHPSAMTTKQLGVDAMNIGKRNAKRKRQEKGITKTGKKSGASGAKSRYEKLPAQVEREHALSIIAEAIAKHPDNPQINRLRELLAEHDDLHSLLATHKEQSVGAMEGDVPVDFGTTIAAAKVKKRLKGDDPASFAAVKLGNKVLTHDQRLLTPRGGGRQERLGGALSVAKDRLEQLEAAALKRHGHVPAPGQIEQMILRGGPSIEELKAEGRNPFYAPDIVKSKAPRKDPGGLGLGVVAAESALRQNLGHVFENGALYRDPEALHIGHLRQVRAQLAHSIHDTLLENGVRVGEHEIVPEGWTYVRADARQEIGHLTKMKGEALKELRGMNEPIKFVGKKAEALMEDDKYIVVPKAYAEKLTGEFSKSDHAFAALWEKPTKVWRAIVLGLRPGFFTNNFVGNYLLYGLRHHGWSAVSAWVSFLKEIKADKALDELGRDVTFRKLAMEHMPELFYGTFGRSQFEDLPGIGKLGRYRQGIGPLTVKVAEEHPRLMIARETVIKEAKRLKIDIPRQTKKFNEMAEDMLKRPGVANQAVEEANRTLGDYLHYTPAEEHLRSIIPFYGWVRAITKIAILTAAETPGRTLLISRLGELAIQENEGKYGPLPYNLMGMIGLSGVKNGEVTGIPTRGLNPASSFADVLKGVTGIASGNPGEGAAALAEIGPHPFLQGLYEWASGKSMLTGGKVKPVILPGLLGYELGSIGANLPPVRLGMTLAGHPRPSKLYANNASKRDAALGFAGVPVKRVRLQQANLSARLPGH
jgi:hypothetical protein